MSVFASMTQALSGQILSNFGEPVVFHLAAQAEALPGRGIFTATFEALDVNTGVTVSSVQPVLEVRLADLSSQPEADDAVIVRQGRYRIVDVQPDGHGFVKLFLHKTRSDGADDDADAAAYPDP